MAFGGPLLSGISIFGRQLVESLALARKSGPKANDFCCHETILAASTPLNILHMGLMSDVAEL
jgi:hypothetical protein